MNTTMSVNIFAIFLIAMTAIEARQIRFNRFGKEIFIDIRNETSVDNVDPQLNNTQPEIQATVRELRPTPYPAAGYRPSRAFNLPNEENNDATITTTTTFSTEFFSTTTTTDAYDLTTDRTTTEIEPPAELFNDDSNKPIEAPYPAAGYRPDRAFKLPNEEQENVEATTMPPQSISQKGGPYPAAGYRPNREFNLPNEIQSASLVIAPEESTASDETSRHNNNATGQESIENSVNNSKNPVCGVSLNPLRPRPASDAKEDPDAERVLVPGVVNESSGNAPITLEQLQLAQPLFAQPFLIPARPMGNYAYSAQFRTW